MQVEEKKTNIVEPTIQIQPSSEKKNEKDEKPKPKTTLEKYPFKIKKKMSNKEVFKNLYKIYD